MVARSGRRILVEPRKAGTESAELVNCAREHGHGLPAAAASPCAHAAAHGAGLRQLESGSPQQENSAGFRHGADWDDAVVEAHRGASSRRGGVWRGARPWCSSASRRGFGASRGPAWPAATPVASAWRRHDRSGVLRPYLQHERPPCARSSSSWTWTGSSKAAAGFFLEDSMARVCSCHRGTATSDVGAGVAGFGPLVYSVNSSGT